MTEVVGRHAVGFVDDDQVRVGPLKLLAQILGARQLVHAGDEQRGSSKTLASIEESMMERVSRSKLRPNFSSSSSCHCSTKRRGRR